MGIRKPMGPKGKRGSALVLSMMFVVIVAGMGVCMVQLHTSQNKRQEQAIDNKRAIYIAEAGLAEGFLSLCVGQSGQIGHSEGPAAHGDGYFWVDATEMGDGQVALVSTGLIGTGRFSIAAVLQRQVDPIASLGFFAGSDLTIEGGVLIDGFDSSQGTYDSQVQPDLLSTGKGAVVGAGGDITLAGSRSGGTIIYGDATPGTTGVVSIGSGATITGATAPRGASVDLPDIEIPEVSERSDLVSLVGRLLLGSGKYGIGTVEVAAGKSLILEGPAVLVIEELILGEGSNLAVDTSEGPVSLYVTGRVTTAATSQFINMEQDPNAFALLISASEWQDFDGDRVADNPVDFNSQGNFHGYIYAPGADITIGSDLHLIGGLAADNVTVKSGAQLSFDQSLITADMAVSGIPMLVAWRTCDVPQVPITDRQTTPEKYMRENAITPVASSEAAEEKYLKMRYYDTSGNPQSYVGASSAFNWNLVGEVVQLVWDDDAVVGDEGQKTVTPVTMTSKTRLVRLTSGKVSD